MPRTAFTFFTLSRAFTLVLCLAWGTIAFGDSGEVLFEWDAIDGAETYRLEIAEKSDFKKIAQSFDVAETRKEVKLKFDKKFFWRVAGKTFLGDLGEWSEPVEIILPSPPKAKLEVAEAQKTQPPTPPPVITKTYLVKRAKYPMWVRAGASGYYHFENVKGDGYNINNSGIPAGKFNLAVGLTSEKSELEGRISYQKLSYSVLNSSLPELQDKMTASYFSATALWRTPFKALGSTITVGGSFKQRPTFVQALPETLAIEPMGAVSFLAGLSSFSRMSAPWYFKWEVLGELSPLGDWVGAGLNVEGTIGYITGKFAPEITFGVNPFYYSTPETKSAIQCDFSVGLLLKWNFGFGEGKPVVRTKVIEGKVEPQKTISPPATDSPPPNSFGPPSPPPSV